MAGDSPYEAVRQYLIPIRLALSCITKVVPDVSGGYYVATDPHRLTLARGQLVPLQGASRLSLTLIQYYRVLEDARAGSWDVETTTYYYGLDDERGHEVVAFHWHPGQPGTSDVPHLHLGFGSGITRPELVGAHIPSGQLAIPDLVRFLLHELAVQPIRDDWESVLLRSETF